MNKTRMMRAATLAGPSDARLREVPVPVPGPGEILIEMEGCGVCGSNLPVWQGRPWFDYPFRTGAPGHEGWGRVAALGPKVTGLREGDRVAALTYRAFAEFDLAAADHVVPLPPALSGRDVPGEALACAMNIHERAAIRPGDLVAVVGTGFLGALLVQLAHRQGAEVIAISRRPSALQTACTLGARHTFIADGQPSEELARQIRTSTRDQGCDVVIEAAGVQSSLDLATRLCRISGRLVLAGFHQDGMRSIDLCDWNWRALDIVNAHFRNEDTIAQGLRKAIDALAEGRLTPDALYTHRVPLERISDAFALLAERPPGFMKVNVLTGVAP